MTRTRVCLAPLLLVVALAACNKSNEPAAADAAAPAKAGAGISEQDIKRVVREGRPAMEKCYVVALEKQPQFSGKVTLVFAVNPDGTVDKKRAGLGGDVGGEEFAKCVLDVVVALKFPASSAATDVEMPLDLGKRADAGVAADVGTDAADARGD